MRGRTSLERDPQAAAMTDRPDTAALPFPVLIADIGGTNARFAVVARPDAETVVFPPSIPPTFPGRSRRSESLGLAATPLAPASAVMAIAGPVTGDVVRMTNSPWSIAPRAMIERLGLGEVVLVNDFEAQALALPRSPAIISTGGGQPHPDKAMVVLGPGTAIRN